MIHWLYRYVFRGIGVLLVIGMITTLVATEPASSRRADAETSSETPLQRLTQGRVRLLAQIQNGCFLRRLAEKRNASNRRTCFAITSAST